MGIFSWSSDDKQIPESEKIENPELLGKLIDASLADGESLPWWKR